MEHVRKPRSRGGVAVAAALALAASLTGGVGLVRAADDAGIYRMLRFDARQAPADGIDRRPTLFGVPIIRRVPGWGPAYAPPPPEAMPADEAPRRRLLRERHHRSIDATSGGDRTMCVRTCDGYAFPLGELQSRRDLPAHRYACDTICPGAKMRLFTIAAGAEDMAEARAEDGTRYSDLDAAFAHRTARNPNCSCQGGTARVAPRLDIRKDITLRRGDMVVTTRGVLVFEGAKEGKRVALSNFAPLAKSKAASRDDVRRVDGIMGTSREAATLRRFEQSLQARAAETGAD